MTTGVTVLSSKTRVGVELLLAHQASSLTLLVCQIDGDRPEEKTAPRVQGLHILVKASVFSLVESDEFGSMETSGHDAAWANRLLRNFGSCSWEALPAVSVGGYSYYSVSGELEKRKLRDQYVSMWDIPNHSQLSSSVSRDSVTSTLQVRKKKLF